MTGRIERKLDDKGFGFIKSNDDGKDYFFHMSNCPEFDFESLQIGELVEFKATKSPKGPRAEDVRRVIEE